MTKYAKGRRLEWKTRDVLVSEGYQVARMAGSKGPVDIIAWNGQETLFIQVKANNPPGPGERDVLRTLPVPPHSRVQFWVWKDRVRVPVRETLRG